MIVKSNYNICYFDSKGIGMSQNPAILSDLVPQSDFTSAYAISRIFLGIGSFCGPTIGGNTLC